MYYADPNTVRRLFAAQQRRSSMAIVAWSVFGALSGALAGFLLVSHAMMSGLCG